MLMGCAHHWITSRKKKKAILLASVEFLEAHGNARILVVVQQECPLSELDYQPQELFLREFGRHLWYLKQEPPWLLEG